jgi:hypothetical protein
MFKFLKEKLNKWAKKVSDETPEEIIEKPKKEIKVPKKFNLADQSYQPDTEKIKEIKKEIKEPEPKPGE